MKQQTITFTDTAEMRKGFRLVWQGVCTAVCAMGRIADKAVHRYPYPFIFATVIVAVVTAVYNIGNARAERDSLNRQCHELRQKMESLQNCLEIGKEAGYVQVADK